MIIAGSITGSPVTHQQGQQPSGGLWLALAARLATVSYHPVSATKLSLLCQSFLSFIL